MRSGGAIAATRKRTSPAPLCSVWNATQSTYPPTLQLSVVPDSIQLQTPTLSDTIALIFKRHNTACNRICLTGSDDDVVLNTGERANSTPVGVFHPLAPAPFEESPCPVPHFPHDQFMSAGHVLFNI